MERSFYTHLLRRWWWTLVLAAWVAGLVGYLAASQIEPTYETRARLLVGPVNTDVTTVRAAESLAFTYAELASTEPQLQRVSERLNLDIDAVDLEGAISVVANGTTRIVSVRATAGDPELAAAIANAVADELIALTTTSVGRPEGELTLIDPASVPAFPTGPNVSVIAFLAASAGFLIAGALVTALEYFSHAIKGRQELSELTGAPTLAGINVNHGYRGTPVQPLVVEAHPDSRTALGYRMLAGGIPFGDADENDRVRSLLIVGSQAEERSGELAANLAAVLARSGRSVTLIDADDLDQQVTRLFVPEGRVGLSELFDLRPELISQTDILDTVRIRRAPGIEIIPAGNRDRPTVPDDIATSLLEVLQQRTDVVIVSGAAIDRSATALTWARLVDAVVITARAEATRVDSVKRAVSSLRMVDAALIGAVLLERRGREPRRRTARGTTKRATIDDLQLRARPIAPSANQGTVSPPGSRGSKGSERRTADKSTG